MTGEELGGFVRTVLSAFGGSFISSGIFTAEKWQVICGAIGVAVAGGWSWWQKRKAASTLADAKR